MESKISVIVPVYNTQKTIEKCIKSILMQTYTNLEIIVVNDGSNDESGRICENIAKTDSRIKYYYKENTGVSDTRNFGLKKASGDYIAFVDSDDFLEKNMYETMIKQINNADILICNCFLINDDKKDVIEIQNASYKNLNEMLKNINNKNINRYLNPPWNKLISRKLIINNNIMFNSKISLGEDLIFNLMCIKFANKIKIISERLYNYVLSENGLNEKKRNAQEFINNSVNLINSLIDISTDDNNLDNIIFNQLGNIIIRMTQNFEKSETLRFLDLIKDKIVNNVNYKILSKKDYIIYFLLKCKKYKIILLVYYIKNTIKRR